MFLAVPASVSEAMVDQSSSPANAAPQAPRGVIAIDKVGNKIRFYDPASLEETKVLDGPEPCVHELAMAPDLQTAFVPLYGDGIYGSNKNPNNKLLVVDLQRQQIAATIDLGKYIAPHGMIATRDGALWVVCDISGALLRIDPAGASVVEAFECPGKGPHLVIASPDESKLYVSNKEAGVSVFDARRGAFVATIAIGNPKILSGNGSGGEGLAFSPDGARLVTVDNDRSDLRVIDALADREIDRVPLSGHPPTNRKRSRLAKPQFSPDGKHLVVTSYATGLCWILDGSNFRRQKQVPVAKGPMGILFEPGGESMIVSSHDSGLLTRIDLAAGRTAGAFDGGAGIEVLAYY
jgi:DNA-binding beta-propeller fold protein YncE